MPADRSVADTILDQLGQGKLVAMTGANTFTSTEDSLSFRIGANPKRINVVRITLRADEYDIEFAKVSKPGMNPRTGELTGGYVVKSKADGIQVSQFRQVFASHTGLDISL